MSGPAAGADLTNAELAVRVTHALRALRARDQVFPKGMFHDPRWYMLLDLYHARLTERSVSVSSLCIASGVAETTALRQMWMMVEEGWLRRRPDPNDGRRHWMDLTDQATDSLRVYFSETAVIEPAVTSTVLPGLASLAEAMLLLIRPALAKMETLTDG